jgi:hypothetical protein
MIHVTTGAPGGARRPGLPAPTASSDTGAVSVEAAYGIAGLVLVAVALAWCLGLLGAELALASATRAAARVAARGESVASVTREAHRLVPDAVVTVRTEADHVVVECRRTVAPPGLLVRLGTVQLDASSVALREQP